MPLGAKWERRCQDGEFISPDGHQVKALADGEDRGHGLRSPRSQRYRHLNPDSSKLQEWQSGHLEFRMKDLRDLRAAIALWRDDDTHQIKLFFADHFDFNRPDYVVEVVFGDHIRVDQAGLEFALIAGELVISDSSTAIQMPPFSASYQGYPGRESRCVFATTHADWVTGKGSKSRVASSGMSEIEVMRLSYGW